MTGGSPAWSADVLRVLLQTGLVLLLGGACASLARVPASSAPDDAVYSMLCAQLAPACLRLSAIAAVNGRDEEAAAAAACLGAADLSAHLLRRCFQGGGGGRPGAGASGQRAPRAVEFVGGGALVGAGAGADARPDAFTVFLESSTLAIVEATTEHVAVAIKTLREQQAPPAGGGDNDAPPPAPGAFARAILLDPERRCQRLAAAWLAYSLQDDLAGVAGAGELDGAKRRLGPRLAQLMGAIDLPAATASALEQCGFRLNATHSLQILASYLHHQELCCRGAGLPGHLLALPPAACAPAQRALADLLAVCRAGGDAERVLAFLHERVVAQMLENSAAVEAASPGWREGSAGALFEAWFTRERPGGGAWELQSQASGLYVLLAEGSTREDGTVAFLEEHAAAHPAEFCTAVEAWLRGGGPVRRRATLLACLHALFAGPDGTARERAAAADPDHLGPRAMSLLLSILKCASAALRTPALTPEQAGTLAAQLAMIGHRIWESARSVERGAPAPAAAAAAASAGARSDARDGLGQAGRTHGLHTTPLSWAVLMARGLAANGRAIRAAAAALRNCGAAGEPGGIADVPGAASAGPKELSVPAAWDSVVSQLRACSLPGASRAAERLRQQGARIPALYEAAAAAAEAEGTPVGSGDGGSREILHGRMTELGAQLEAFGAAAGAQLPLRGCCNNHGCESLGTASEAALVKGRSCSGCGAAAYCSKECQRAHWAWHKPVCKALKG